MLFRSFLHFHSLSICLRKKVPTIRELDCPRCHEPGGIEAFVKDGILAEDGVCDNCGYILPEGTELEEVE